MHQEHALQHHLVVNQLRTVRPILELFQILMIISKETHYDYFYLLPNCVTGCDHAKDLNVLLVFSGKATCIFPLDALDSGRIELFGSTAIKNSSFTTANKSFIIAMHGSIVRDELVGNKSILRGLSDEICKK